MEQKEQKEEKKEKRRKERTFFRGKCSSIYY